MNQYVRAEIAFAREQLGKRYVIGGMGPDEWDCIWFVRKSARAAGLDGSVVPGATNVRVLRDWAEANGRLRLASSGYEPKRGDIFLWGKADGDHRPVKGAGHTGFVLRPPSPSRPLGKAISAYNPQKGVIIHDLIPTGRLALYGYVEQDFPAAPAPAPEPPTNDLETPPPSDAAEEQPDDPPSAAELQARIDEAVEVLTK